MTDHVADLRALAISAARRHAARTIRCQQRIADLTRKRDTMLAAARVLTEYDPRRERAFTLAACAATRMMAWGWLLEGDLSKARERHTSAVRTARLAIQEGAR